MRTVEAPGRFEVVSHAPLVVLDAAHNLEGTTAAATTMAEEFRPEGTLTLVTGLLGNRPIEETLAPLVGLGPRRIVCVEADSPRAVPASEVASAISRLVQEGAAPLVPEVTVVPDVAEGVTGAAGRLQDTDALLVAGSTYVVGAARAALRAGGLGVPPLDS